MRKVLKSIVREGYMRQILGSIAFLVCRGIGIEIGGINTVTSCSKQVSFGVPAYTGVAEYITPRYGVFGDLFLLPQTVVVAYGSRSGALVRERRMSEEYYPPVILNPGALNLVHNHNGSFGLFSNRSC